MSIWLATTSSLNSLKGRLGKLEQAELGHNPETTSKNVSFALTRASVMSPTGVKMMSPTTDCGVGPISVVAARVPQNRHWR